MLPDKVQQWAGYFPAVFLGLFLGRVVSEQLRPGLAGAILLTLALCLLALFLLRRISLNDNWPLLLLSLYVLAPDPDPRTAATVTFLTTITFLLNLKTTTFGDLDQPT